MIFSKWKQLRWSTNNLLNGSIFLAHVVILPDGPKSYMGYDTGVCKLGRQFDGNKKVC